jgi:hypothetical protein
MQIRLVVVKLLGSATYDETSKVVAFRNFFANESKNDSTSLQYFTDWVFS